MEYASHENYRNEYLTAMGKPPYADIITRIMAYLIDSFFILLVLMVLWLTIGQAADKALGGIATGWYVVAATVFIWSYETAFLSSKYQATPGKIAMGLKVVDVSGKRLSPSKALVRSLVKYAAYLFGAVNFEPRLALVSLFGVIDNMFILTGERRQALHDRVVNTVVIYVSEEKQL